MSGLTSLIKSRLDHIRSVVVDNDLIADLKKIPKHEFHVHLGGSIRRETALDLAQKNNIPLPSSKEDFLKAAAPLVLFQSEYLWQLFHKTYQWHWSCVKTCDDLQRIVFEFLEDSCNQGVIHSEFTVSGTYLMKTFPFDEWVDAISLGIKKARSLFSIKAAVILDISRRSGPENAIKSVEKIIKRGRETVCAIGMGGDEVKYPHHLFTKAFALAKESKIPSTVHVSEFRDGSTTTDAIRDLSPNRLGHALTTIKSAKAYEALKESGLHVESCPLCNYVGRMGDIGHLSEHPIKQYYDDGIPVSINTDDPQIFGFDLLDNYYLLMKEAGFEMEDFNEINLAAAKHAFY